MALEQRCPTYSPQRHLIRPGHFNQTQHHLIFNVMILAKLPHSGLRDFISCPVLPLGKKRLTTTALVDFYLSFNKPKNIPHLSIVLLPNIASKHMKTMKNSTKSFLLMHSALRILIFSIVLYVIKWIQNFLRIKCVILKKQRIFFS